MGIRVERLGCLRVYNSSVAELRQICYIPMADSKDIADLTTSALFLNVF